MAYPLAMDHMPMLMNSTPMPMLMDGTLMPMLEYELLEAGWA